MDGTLLGDRAGLLCRREDERQRRSAMFSIDQEIGVQRQDGMPIMDFRHTNDACIGERHRRVPVFLQQLAQRADMLIDPECDAQRSMLDKLQDGNRRLWVTREQVHRFGEHRLTDEERRIELLEALRDPAVVLFRPVEKRDQRSRINDGYGHRGRSPRDAWDS